MIDPGEVDRKSSVNMSSQDMEEGLAYRASDSTIYVTLGTVLKKEGRNLLWVLKNFPGAAIVIIHVHQPSKWTNIMGAKVANHLVSEECVSKHQCSEKKIMKNLLHKYMSICRERKVQVKALVITNGNVSIGVHDLVKQLRITRLVTGCRLILEQAERLQYCNTWLVCNGKLISSSEVTLQHSGIHERNSEHLSDMTSAMDSNECNHYPTSSTEQEVRVNDDHEEAKSLNNEAMSSSINEVTRVEDKEVKVLRKRLKKAEEEATRAKEALSALEQHFASLQQEHCEAEKEIEALMSPQDSREFAMSDLEKATNNFHPSRKIGEGGYGPVYKGLLYNMPAAIKMLNPESRQGQAQYQQEVLVLSKVRHPNIVVLLGVCSQSCSLVYEYLANGTLDERLARKNGAPPLSWQDRVRIIAEQRSALNYLHRSEPHAIVHSDVKMANILLDANNVSRLGDFGAAQLVRSDGSGKSVLCRNGPAMGTFGYIDPQFLIDGELATSSDVYSFGVIVLRLLTGLAVLKIAERVEEGLRAGPARRMLDASAGEWPAMHAEAMLRLALRCCSGERAERPELVSEEWRVLEMLRVMAGNHFCL